MTSAPLANADHRHPPPLTSDAQRIHAGRFVVDFVAHPADPERRLVERALLEDGVHLPLPHRLDWAQSGCEPSSWFFAIADPMREFRFAFAAVTHGSRALPGHRVVRVERFGASGTLDAVEAGIHALRAVSRTERRILRVHVEVFSNDPVRRVALARVLASAGFRRARHARCYADTIALDLAPPEETIFAELHRTARRHIRSVGKKPVEVRVIDDLALAERMQALLDETLARTGGTRATYDWRRLIQFSARHPALSRLAGLFRTDRTGPEALVAFAWGCHHGDHAHYSTAASTRDADLHIPYGYGPAWDLALWAKRGGASWFDFGGVTAGHNADAEDPLGGISDFKRYFSPHAVAVGEEWIYEPHPLRAAAARLISASARFARRRMPRVAE